MVQDSELVSCCGVHCAGCEVFQGKVKDAALTLWKILDTNICTKRVLTRERFSYLQKGLTFLAVRFGQCEGCGKGGGDPSCDIRQCCEAKGLRFCIECDMSTCEKLSL